MGQIRWKPKRSSNTDTFQRSFRIWLAEYFNTTKIRTEYGWILASEYIARKVIELLVYGRAALADDGSGQPRIELQINPREWMSALHWISTQMDVEMLTQDVAVANSAVIIVNPVQPLFSEIDDASLSAPDNGKKEIIIPSSSED